MTAQSRTTLKGYFNTGDTPTEAEFAHTIDSFHNLTDDGTAKKIDETIKQKAKEAKGE